MRIAILEYLSGGGLLDSCEDESNLDSLFDEGIGMLLAVAEDLTICGHEVVLPLEDRRTKTHAHRCVQLGIETVPVYSPDDWKSTWIELCKSADRTLLIAPEMGNRLLSLLGELRATGSTIVAPSLEFVELASDKLKLASIAIPRIHQPKTYSASQYLLRGPGVSPGVAKASPGEAPGAPVGVVKDRFGAGCSLVHPCRSIDEICSFLSEKGAVESDYDDLIVQTWIEGEHYSLSLIGDSRGESRLVGCLRQSLSFDGEVIYTGGAGPEFEEFRPLLELWCKELFSHLPIPLGWIGIDIVVSPPEQESSGPIRKEWNIPLLDQIHLIEINPRLTSSYLGFRQLYGPSLAEGCLDIAHDWRSIDIGGKWVEF